MHLGRLEKEKKKKEALIELALHFVPQVKNVEHVNFFASWGKGDRFGRNP